MLLQAVQIAGSLLILSAFVAAQAGRLRTTSPTYLALNALGSTVLGVLAALDLQYGFLLLEGVWALVSGFGLIALMRRRGPAAIEH